MKHALAAVASVAAGALAVGAGPAAADLPVAGNSANDSIGTVQAGPVVASPAAVVTTPVATAAASDVLPTIGGGRNSTSKSVGTAQVGGGNSAKHSIGTVQVSSVRVAPRAHVVSRPVGVELRLGGDVGVAGGRNSADHSVGTVQAGGIDVAPGASLKVGPAAETSLGGGTSIGGGGGNDADRSIGTVQIGGGSGGGSGGDSGTTSGAGTRSSGERSLASAAQAGGASAAAGSVAHEAGTVPPTKKGSTTFRPPARAVASRQTEGTVAQPTSTVLGASLPFTGLTLVWFLGAALSLALLGTLVRRAARAA